jgi:hypothetical protein
MQVEVLNIFLHSPRVLDKSPMRASVGSTEASASLLARVGVVGPTRARAKEVESLGRILPRTWY